MKQRDVSILIFCSCLCLATFFSPHVPNAVADQPSGKEQRKETVDQKVAEQLAVIAKAGPQGAGSATARVARDELAKRGIEILPQLLAAMDTPNVIAANWYRTVYEDVVSRELAQPDATWPLEFFKEYVSNARRAGRPRRLVLALLDRLEPGFSEGWLPTRVEDADFRFEAVSLTLAAGEKALRDKNPERAKTEFRKAFEHARDSAHVTQAASNLKSLGEPADVIGHLGLVVEWWLVGPFDAPEKTGFARAFEPESKVDLKARYKGQAGDEIRWARHSVKDALGQLDLNQALGATREAVAYAYAEIDVPREQPAQLRCGADDNCTVWLNDRKVFAREQWLNGTRFDRFVTPITLTTGRNTLLVKVCQGPQHKDPEVPNNWTVQLRLCDELGRGIAFKSILPESPAVGGR